MVFNVDPGKINYVGEITIAFRTERYEDKNNDGYIDSNEFKSSTTDFRSVAGGKEEFSKDARWNSVAIQVDDNFDKLPVSEQLIRSIPNRIEFGSN